MKKRTFMFDKLVRDKIPESTERRGGSVELRILRPEERVTALIDKVIEEAHEVPRSKNPVQELADLKEAFEEVAEQLGIPMAEIEACQRSKRAKMGGFKMGYFVITQTLPETDELIERYLSEPERFPEVTDE